MSRRFKVLQYRKRIAATCCTTVRTASFRSSKGRRDTDEDHRGRVGPDVCRYVAENLLRFADKNESCWRHSYGARVLRASAPGVGSQRSPFSVTNATADYLPTYAAR